MSCHRLGLLAPNGYEVDLSNEILNIDFGQGGAKISDVKVGGRKKYLPSSQVQTHAPAVGCVGRFFFNL